MRFAQPRSGFGLRASRQGPATATIAQASAKPGTSAKSAARGSGQAASKASTARGSKAGTSTSSQRGSSPARRTRGGGSGGDEAPAAPRRPTGQGYFNFTGFPFPLGPFFSRNTLRREVERDVWVFEQTQALDFFDVYTPVRMTVIKLASGGLWVHAPVAPTDECVRLIKELDAPVEYIVLPTFAYEHKIFVGPFSRRFPEAKVYVTPFQWSFPLNLPPQFFGIFPTGELINEDTDAPWADEIEQKLLMPPSIGVGNYVRFCEAAFFHRRTRTLMVTDAVIFVPEDPPEVIPVPALLATARDGALACYVAGGRSKEEVAAIAQTEPVEDSREARRKGWRRMALLVLYFNPSDLLTAEASFAAISNRLFVGPVVETLVYSKIPKSVVDWVEDICEWDFKQVIPCHFEAPVRAGPAEFRRAFTFAYRLAEADGLLPPPAPATEPKPLLPALPQLSSFLTGLLGALGGGSGAAAVAVAGSVGPRPVDFPAGDMKTLNSINDTLLRLGAVRRNADLDAAIAQGTVLPGRSGGGGVGAGAQEEEEEVAGAAGAVASAGRG